MTTFQLGQYTVNRVGFGAMQLPGPGVFGPPRDHDQAIAVLRARRRARRRPHRHRAVLRPGRGQRADPRGAAPVPRRTWRWSARSAPAATARAAGCRPQRTRRAARRHRGQPARRSASTSWPRSTCASTRRTRTPRAVDHELFDGQLDRDDRRPRRGPDRRHRAVQRHADAPASRARPHRDRHACRTPTTWWTARRSPCSTCAPSAASRSSRSSRWARRSAPTTRCSATRRSAGRRGPRPHAGPDRAGVDPGRRAQRAADPGHVVGRAPRGEPGRRRHRTA